MKNFTAKDSIKYNLPRGKSPIKKQKPTIARIAAATASAFGGGGNSEKPETKVCKRTNADAPNPSSGSGHKKTPSYYRESS